MTQDNMFEYCFNRAVEAEDQRMARYTSQECSREIQARVLEPLRTRTEAMLYAELLANYVASNIASGQPGTQRLAMDLAREILSAGLGRNGYVLNPRKVII